MRKNVVRGTRPKRVRAQGGTNPPQTGALSAVCKNMADMAYLITPDGDVAPLFGSFPEFCGLSAAEFLRCGPAGKDGCGAEARAAHRQAHERAMRGETVHYEWKAQAAGGPLCYQTSLIPLFGPRGRERHEVCAVLGIGRDVSAVPEMERRLSLYDTEVRDFSQEVLNVREEEKRKVSSALHDELGSSSVAIMSLFGILEEDIKDGRKDSALANITRLGDTVAELMGRLRHIAVDLRPPNLETVGLAGAVKDLVERLTDFSRCRIEYSSRVAPQAQVSDAVAITVYRAAQESLSNAMRHADATRIKISLIIDGSAVRLAVSDNGRGFDGRRLSPSSKKGRIGILGMKESVEYIGGKLEIDTASGQGTVVKVTCPAATYMG